jgi:hypothetical protein
MSYPLNYPTPQNADIQIFNAGNSGVTFNHTWTKPQGASFVWFTLIGSGGGANSSGGTGGGSGAVTNCLVPAFLIPDVLRITVGKGGAVSNDGIITRISYYNKASYSLLEANGGGIAQGGLAFTSNYFSAMGFFQSIDGQTGTTSAATASATTFLSAGSAGANAVTANYGYASDATSGQGFFQLQPIIVGVGGGGAGNAGKGGIGCGGASGSGIGGDGLVVIITW